MVSKTNKEDILLKEWVWSLWANVSLSLKNWCLSLQWKLLLLDYYFNTSVHECILSLFSLVLLFVTLWTVAHRLFCSWDSPDKNTGVDCHALLQGIFPTQEFNLHLLQLLHCRQILYHWATGETLLEANRNQITSLTFCLESSLVKYPILPLARFIFYNALENQPSLAKVFSIL